MQVVFKENLFFCRCDSNGVIVLIINSEIKESMIRICNQTYQPNVVINKSIGKMVEVVKTVMVMAMMAMMMMMLLCIFFAKCFTAACHNVNELDCVGVTFPLSVTFSTFPLSLWCFLLYSTYEARL